LAADKDGTMSLISLVLGKPKDEVTPGESLPMYLNRVHGRTPSPRPADLVMQQIFDEHRPLAREEGRLADAIDKRELLTRIRMRNQDGSP
jgi:hypothetical protein